MLTLLGLLIWAIVEMAVSCNGWEEGLTGKLDYSDEYCGNYHIKMHFYKINIDCYDFLTYNINKIQ